MTIADFISENEKQMVKTDIKIQLAVQRDIQTKIQNRMDTLIISNKMFIVVLHYASY